MFKPYRVSKCVPRTEPRSAPRVTERSQGRLRIPCRLEERGVHHGAAAWYLALG
jgi:hypothetical protein